MSVRDRLTLAAALAVALACSALAPLYAGNGWLPETLGGVLLVAAAGGVARRGGLPALAVPPLQALAVAAYVAVVFAGSTLRGPLPTWRTVAALRALLVQAAVDIEQLAPPVPSVGSLVLVAVLGAAAVALVVDLLAVGLQRPALAGLPLLVLLAVPSGLLPGGLGWLPFTLGAAGWLGLLLVEGTERVGRWGVPLRSAPASSSSHDADAGSTARVGRRIGATALGIAAFVPALVPGLDARLLPGTGGWGDGDATGPSRTVTYNPVTELQGQLNLPEPRTALRYTTTDPAPDYLRLTTLDVFDGSQWSSSSLEPDVDVDGGIPVPAGLAPTNKTYGISTRVSIAALRAQWLPLPPVPTAVDVPGPWSWDVASETVFATRSNTRRARDYTVRSTRVTPSRASLQAAADVPDAVRPYAARPEVTEYVDRVTREAVAGADTPYEQAVALQTFFRGPSFEYSEQTQNPFDNPNALEAFLNAREGFCEQYASAMAAMLRGLEIPARVAVGFTPGQAQSDGTHVVSTDDAHAWPEAWFEGSGWIRFEPTPVSSGREIVPQYTEGADAPADGTSPGAGPSAGPVPSASAAAQDSKDLDRALGDDSEAPLADPSAGVGGTGLPSTRALLVGLVTALAVAPSLVAALRRRRRWHSPDALTAWQQLRDDAADVGHRWRPAESPRSAATRLATDRRLAPDAVEALDRLVVGVERARYARPGSPAWVGSPGSPGSLGEAPWQADARGVRAALLHGASRGTRLRAVLAPPSALQWLGARCGGLVADLLDRSDDVVSAVTRRLRPRRRDPAG